MKKIITAIGNPAINEILKEKKELDIIGSDAQYKEAIFEMLEINKIDFLIISDTIFNNENLFEEIVNIKKWQKNIKIILLVKNKNNNFEKIKKQKNIYLINFNKKYIIEKINKIINNKYQKNIIKKDLFFINCNLNIKLNKNMFFENTKIILIIEPNLNGIKKANKYINEILNNKYTKKNNINIIFNNYNKYSFDMQILKFCFKGINVIGKINQGDEYEFR